jgi:uncharacterized glyoxalase superfamily protein PhnB
LSSAVSPVAWSATISGSHATHSEARARAAIVIGASQYSVKITARAAPRAIRLVYSSKEPPMSVAMDRLSPVLVVEAVEPCIRFWADTLGFAIENQVPGSDGALVFASVKSGAVEIMYQTRASVLAETPEAEADLRGHSTVLFITVPSLDAVERALAGAPVVKPRHKTFYGSEEIYVKEPGGNTVGFAQFG